MNYRIPLILGLSLLTLSGLKAQEDFAELSSKARINIAEKEESEAAHDAQFQEMMQKGHQLFKNRHYLKAIHAYEKAQDRRPYNVYPKVIIADIELSMKDTLQTLRAAEQNQIENLNPKPETKPEIKEDTTPETTTETEAERIKKQNEWEAEERRKLKQQRKAEAENQAPAEVTMDGDIQKLSSADYQKALAEKYPEGMTEKVTKEGNKVIVERVVVSNGVGNDYKKVTHNWGGVFYFKNGDAVTERVWKEETEK